MIIPFPKAHEAAEVLGVVLEGLTEEALNKAYRDKAKLCHPDHHGPSKLDVWAKVSWAKECLTFWIEQHPEPLPVEERQGDGDCRACEGTGRVNVRKRGFGTPLTMACLICRGMGTVLPEEDDGD